MTEQTPPLADEPIPDAEPEGEGAGASARAREWLAQLESMIQQISSQAAPVARQVSAKAAELAALAAVKAGPAAHKAADLTTEYGQKFADRAQSVAADLRHRDTASDGGDDTAAIEPDPGDSATAEPKLADDPAEGPAN